ncbi:LCP family protein [Actinoplanes sp. NPDC051861]|uniref:LCP family protein n=1 Tax=Actinoplanes sp. NPDC051861 TaxID=3155170 RepID=UPI003433AF8C
MTETGGREHVRKPGKALLRIAAGCLLLITATGAHAAVPQGIDGPINLLLVGIDPRGTHTIPLADSIIVAHIPADRDGAYLFSLPRDLVVRIPAFAPSGTAAERRKINAAMALGSVTPGRDPSAEQGYELLSRTVGQVTGIAKFDAGAVVTFGGFTKIVGALGGIRMAIDQDVVSEHRRPDGTARDRLPECRGDHNCLRPYTGPQKIYPKSDKPVRLEPWEALDFLRQRYGLPRSDYDRQRHQRQFLTAVAKKLRKHPEKLASVISAAGKDLTFLGGGHTAAAWAAELKDIRITEVRSIDLPGSALFERGKYLGEKLPPATGRFFTAVAQDRVASFLIDHPGVVTVDGWPPRPRPQRP